MALVKSTAADMLITDIRMPGCSGLELIEQVRKQSPKIKIIIISGYANFEYAQRALKDGVNDYLLKPINKVALNEAVERLAGMIRSERQNRAAMDASVERMESIHRLRSALISDLLSVNPPRADRAVLEEKYHFACGAGVFNSVRVGVLLFVSHVVSAILVGIIFRRSSPCGDSVSVKNIHVYKPLTFALTESVRDAVQGIINICGFVIIFQVLSAVIRSSGLILTGDLGTLTEGFLELTAGIYRLNVSNYITAMTIASFLIGWGGLCVHCQALSYTVPRGLRTHMYFIGKLLHGVISAAVTYIAVSVFG
jgi:CheY-like chemotaxis protein